MSHPEIDISLYLPQSPAISHHESADRNKISARRCQTMPPYPEATRFNVEPVEVHNDIPWGAYRLDLRPTRAMVAAARGNMESARGLAVRAGVFNFRR